MLLPICLVSPSELSMTHEEVRNSLEPARFFLSNPVNLWLMKQTPSLSLMLPMATYTRRSLRDCRDNSGLISLLSKSETCTEIRLAKERPAWAFCKRPFPPYQDRSRNLEVGRESEMRSIGRSSGSWWRCRRVSKFAG